MVNQKNACRACSSVPTRSWPWELSIWISVSALVLLCSAWKAAAMNPIYIYLWGAGVSLVAQMVKNLPAMQGTCVQFLGWEDPLVEGVANHSSIFAWGIPWTQEPGGLQSMGLQRGRHNWATNTDKVIWYVCVGCVLCLQTGPFALPVCVLGVLLWRCVCVCVWCLYTGSLAVPECVCVWCLYTGPLAVPECVCVCLCVCGGVCVCVVLIHRPSGCSWVYQVHSCLSTLCCSVSQDPEPPWSSLGTWCHFIRVSLPVLPSQRSSHLLQLKYYPPITLSIVFSS